MKRLHFSIQIKSQPHIIYHALTDSEQFAIWSNVFDPNSHVEGSWEKGSLVRFMTYDSTGKLCGLLSRVRDNIPNRKIHLDHVGVLEDGLEIFEGPKVDKIKGASEIYHVLPQREHTLLEVESDAIMDLDSYLNQTWPLALEKLKELCENLNT